MENINISEQWLMAGFGVVILIMLLLDLGVFNRKAHKINNKEAILWSVIWILLALSFGWFVFHYMGRDASSDYLSAYLIEKALSMDNLFVFILIFGYFKVPDQYQHKVLFYGIMGAIVFRAIFIFVGVEMIKLTYLPEFILFNQPIHLNAVLTTFGFFLVYAGYKTFFKKSGEAEDMGSNWAVRITKKLIPVSDKYDGSKFFSRINGKRFATPLLLVVVVIEATDIMFAVDSIPAIFAITDDPFILYTSNIFAILGLRALYFLLANLMPMFRFLHYGLAIILIFIGIKMLIVDFVKIPSPVSLTIVAAILILSVLLSILIKTNIHNKPIS
ncbi:MAG: TerC family protein [Bacteroidales bacterium]|nr:TerC family protein [Bacteroidales bacterium]